MKAVIYTASGDMELRDVPTPSPGPSQVRVRVQAGALNRVDILQRRGYYPAPPGWPADIPGLEYAGEVDALGSGATRWRPGDRVMGLVGGGAHAEYVVVHQDETLAVPPGMPLSDAAAIPEAFLTGWDALVTWARLQPGERVLIHAVGSGVGTAAVQLARRLGAVAIGTSRSSHKLDRARVLGLDEAIDTSAGRFRDRLHAPVNVILDVLGGPALADNLQVLAPRGRLVLLGFLQGAKAEASLEPILRKRLEVIGSVMRTRGLEERIELARDFTDRVLPWFEARRLGGSAAREHGLEPESAKEHAVQSRAAEPPGRQAAQLRPVVGERFDFSDIAAAHAAMEQDRSFGKIVLTWD